MRNSVDVRRAAMCDTSRRQILVVDDEASIRESLEMLLTSAGYDVAIAKDGFDALLQIKRSLPDVIVSDLNMPQMSGFEFLSVVRRRFPQIPVIAMSGHTAGTPCRAKSLPTLSTPRVVAIPKLFFALW